MPQSWRCSTHRQILSEHELSTSGTRRRLERRDELSEAAPVTAVARLTCWRRTFIATADRPQALCSSVV